MNSIVIYGTRTGEDRPIAEEIADVLARLGDVRLLMAGDATAVEPHHGELLVVGSSTEGHTMTPAVRDFLDRLVPKGLWGVRAAVFDTRQGMPRWPTSTAAPAITARLDRLGAHLIEPVGKFIVAGRPAALVPGELERARAWAAALADAAAPASAPKMAAASAR